MKKDGREFIERQFNKGNKLLFIIIYPHEGEIYLDTKCLPNSAMLCAMCDGISFLQCKVGEKTHLERTFVSLDWAVNDWGGPSDIVDILKKVQENQIRDMEDLKTKVQKYAN